MYLRSKVPDIDCSWHFMVLYPGKIPIIFMYVFFFPGRNFDSILFSLMILKPSYLHTGVDFMSTAYLYVAGDECCERYMQSTIPLLHATRCGENFPWRNDPTV